MTSVGVKWENGVLEAGITARTRAEFDEHLRKIEAVAALAWPAGSSVPDLARDPAEPVDLDLFGGTSDPVGIGTYDDRRAWKERQGL